MILVAVRFDHYSPKDYESGIKYYLICDTIEQAIRHIDKDEMFGRLEDMKYDGDTDAVDFEHSRKSRPDPESFGLTVESGFVEGASYDITRWYGGTDWEDVGNDRYYGVTHYNWRDTKEITATDAATLVSLGIAKDIRGT